MNVVLNCGGQPLPLDLPEARVAWKHLGPEAVPDLSRAIEEAFRHPVDYPRLEQAIVPGDRITLVVDPETPRWAAIVAAVARQLHTVGIEPDALQVVINRTIPAALRTRATTGLELKVSDHGEVMAGQQVYLATTADGERIYLPGVIAEADFLITIGCFRFDDQIGYQGTHSSVYPAFAQAADRARLRARHHQELTPESSFGLRTRIDEIGWLLGIQYSIQVIPSGSGDVAQIVCGASDSVYRYCVDQLNSRWRLAAAPPAETAVLAVSGSDLIDPWSALSRAAQTAAQLVSDGGRVVLLAPLDHFSEKLTDLLASGADEDELLRRLNRSPSPQANAAHDLIRLALRARVYLRSSLEPDLVENLFCIPLTDDHELRQALAGGESFVILNGAQYLHVEAKT